MTTTTESTWRDYIDQLTPEQVADLEELAQPLQDPEYRFARKMHNELREIAASYVRSNEAVARFGDVPYPAGAVCVDEWADAASDEPWRVFYGAKWEVAECARAGVEGSQRPDGSVEERWIRGHVDVDLDITAEQARQIAGAFLAAAEELDKHDTHSLPTVSLGVVHGVAVPPGATDVDEWQDLEHKADAYRMIWGTARGGGDRRQGIAGNYVEAVAVQGLDGKLIELCVRAEIAELPYAFRQHHDDMLSPAEARQRATKFESAAADLSQLAVAFRAAANEVEMWTAPPFV